MERLTVKRVAPPPGATSEPLTVAKRSRTATRLSVEVTLLFAVSVMALWRGCGAHDESATIRTLLQELASKYPGRAARAERDLEAYGAAAVPTLARALHTRDSRLGELWRQFLSRWFDRGKRRATPADIRLVAARRLSELGSLAAPAAGDLIEVLGEVRVGDYAASALRGIGSEAVPQLIRALQDPRPRVRASAANLLGDRQNSSSLAVRTGAVDLLLRLLGDGDEMVRCAAANALASIAADRAETIAGLTHLLLETEPLQVRGTAIIALKQCGPRASAAIPVLSLLLKDPSPLLRMKAAQALWAIERRPQSIVAELVALLPEPAEGWEAALLLAELGPAAETAIPALLDKLEMERTHRPSRTPSMTAVALGKFGPASVPGLVKLLDHPEADVRVNAAAGLVFQGPSAAPAVPGLIRMLSAADPEERMTAANSLAAIGPAAHEAVFELTRLSLETSGDVIVGHVASSAREALKRIREPSTTR